MDGVTDVEELNSVLDRAVGLRAFLAADERIEKVAAFVADHFRQNIAPLGYKAFLVAVNREACAKYKLTLDKHLPSEWSVPVYSENPDDVVERPIVAEYQLSPNGEKDAREMFKKAGENPRILIVTDKLLTGFDASLLYCLYLDKPMHDHVLLQAISRANRPYTDDDGSRKSIGLVVDFVGVLRELNKALRFDSSDVSGVIEDLELLHSDFRKKIAAATAEYLDGLAGDGDAPDDARLEHIVYDCFLLPEAREEFYTAYKDVETLWEILSPSPELRDHIDTFRQLATLYRAVRAAYADRPLFTADLARKTRRLVEESASMYGLGALTKAITFDRPTIESLRNESGSNEAKVFNLVRGLRAEADGAPELDAALRPIRERAENVLRNLEGRALSGLAAKDMLVGLAAEKDELVAAARESELPPRPLACTGRCGTRPRLKPPAERNGVRVGSADARRTISQHGNKRGRAEAAEGFSIHSTAGSRKRRTEPYCGTGAEHNAGRRSG